MHLHGLFVNGRGGLCEGLGDAIEIVIVTTPHPIAGPNACTIDGPIRKTQPQLPIMQGGNAVNTPAFFGFLRAAPVGGIKHNAITQLKRRNLLIGLGCDDNAHGCAI